jgi:hypothetical protein
MMEQLEKNIIYSFGLAKKEIGGLKQNVTILNESNQKMIAGMEDMRIEIEDLKRKVLALSLKLESEKKTIVVKEAPSQEKVKVIKVSAPKTLTKTVVRVQRPKKTFIASKTGKKFHMPTCIFTKNIKPKMMLKFKSKKAAMNRGYRACDCI